MSERNIDSPIITTAVMNVVESILAKLNGVVATSQPQIVQHDIIEYDNRLRVSGMEKFNSPSYVSVVNYYLSQNDVERHRAKGAMILYIDSENAGKLFKALGFPVTDDEDDVSMMDSCGRLCNLVGEGVRAELEKLGYVNLVMPSPCNYRNSILEGVEYSTDQEKLHEFSFFYWKHKLIVLELTLAPIPMKK